MTVQLRASVDAQDVAKVARILRRVDKELLNELGRGMRSGLGGTAQQIAAQANMYGAPLSGFLSHRGETRWGNVSGKISTTPGRSRFGWGNLVTMLFDAGKTSRGLYISEFAGSKNPNGSPIDARGPWFVGMLNIRQPNWAKGGRYVYQALMPFKRRIYVVADDWLTKWSDRVNKELGG